MTNPLDTLVDMTRALGEPHNDYVIIGEGNTSMTINAESFAVKASGHQMHNISADGFVTVYFEPILALLDDPPATMSEQKAITQSAVFDRSSVLPPNALGGTEGGLSPSIEVSFHAMLLRECGVKFIGHTAPHPPSTKSCARTTRRTLPISAASPTKSCFVVPGPYSCLMAIPACRWR